MTIIWCMVPEIQSATDRIFCHFGPNTWRYNFLNVYQNGQSYDVWFLRYGGWPTKFFVILYHFLHFYPLTTWTIKILKNWKKYLEILSFTHVYHKCMVPEIWSTTEFFVLLDHFFCHFTPLTTWKIKILKN